MIISYPNVWYINVSRLTWQVINKFSVIVAEERLITMFDSLTSPFLWSELVKRAGLHDVKQSLDIYGNNTLLCTGSSIPIDIPYSNFFGKVIIFDADYINYHKDLHLPTHNLTHHRLPKRH